MAARDTGAGALLGTLGLEPEVTRQGPQRQIFVLLGFILIFAHHLESQCAGALGHAFWRA